MKRLGMLLVLASVSLFALGCEKPAPSPPPEPPKDAAPGDAGPTVEPVADPPAEGAEK